MESDSVIYGLLGRIHLLMRRTCNRITDVEYMRANKDYAREIVRLASAAGNDELAALAGRLRVAMELDAPVEAEGERLVTALRGLAGPVVLVSNEVGLGIVPMEPMSRAFLDHAGRLHQKIAALADWVQLMAAGLALDLKRPDARCTS